MCRLFLSILFLLSVFKGFSQDAVNFNDIFWPFEIVRKELPQSNFYKAVRTLTSVDEKLINNPDFYGQALMTAYCFCGDMENKEKASHTYRQEKTALKNSEILIEEVYLQDAKFFIIEQAKDYSVMMINEAHLYPQHRVFFKSLLKELYEIGYRHLCLEDLAAGDYFGIEYPKNKMGFYINEPTMGELVREALKLGYKLHAYDEPEKSNRDSVAAENIYTIYNTYIPKSEKVLVYCGFAHNMESRKKSMASYFKSISRIDPLTVDQTTYYEAEHSPFYDELLDFYQIQSPAILITQEGEAAKMNKNFCDCTIISPRTTYRKKRPEWLISIDKRQEIDIHPEFQEGIIEVYYENEANGSEAIPVERLVIENTLNENTVTLLLPEGASYICKYFDANHHFLSGSKLDDLSTYME